MNFPLKGDVKFIKNLKKGDHLYTIDIGWDADKGRSDINIGELDFDHYDDIKTIDENGDSVFGYCGKGDIKTEKHNLCYGFFETPKKALIAIKSLVEDINNVVDEALSKEK